MSRLARLIVATAGLVAFAGLALVERHPLAAVAMVAASAVVSSLTVAVGERAR